MNDQEKKRDSKRRCVFPSKTLIERTMRAVKGFPGAAVEFHSSNNTTRIVLGANTTAPHSNPDFTMYREFKL